MSWRDPKFHYLAAATHADPVAFARRQKARQRDAQAAAQAQTAAHAAKVRPIRKRAS